MDCSLPGSSVHGIFQARVREWGAIKSSIKENTTYKAKGKHVTNGTICIIFKLQKLDLVKGQATFVFSFTTHFLTTK